MSFSRLRESFRSSNKDFSGPSQDVLDAWIEEEEEEEREFREEVNCQDGSVLFHEEDSHFSEYNYSLSSGYKKNSKANKKKDEKTDTVQPDDVSQCSTLTTDLDDHGIDDVIDELFPTEEQEQEPVKEHVPVTPRFPSSAEKRVLVIQQETAVQPEQALPQEEEKEPVAPKLTNQSERTVRTRRRSEARKKAALSALSERSERLDHRRRESIRKATSLRNLAVEKEPKQGLWWTSIVKTVGSVFQKKNESEKDELKDLEQQFHSSCPTLGESFISDFVSEEEPWMMNQPPTPKSSKRRISFQWRQGAQSSLAEF